MRSDATPGDAPAAVAPDAAAAPLLGTWALSVWGGEPGIGEAPPMTATFDDAGVVTTTYDCKGLDGKKPLVNADFYHVAGDEFMTVADVASGNGLCTEGNGPPNVSQGFMAQAFEDIRGATWVVDGDSLTISVDGQPTWLLERTPG